MTPLSRSSSRPALRVLLASATLALGACGGGDAESSDDDATTTTAAPASVVAGSVDESTLGAPYLGALTFAWPKDCAVDVHETVLKGGKEAELEYRLELTAEGDRTVVALRDLRVLELDGEDLTAAQRRAVAAAFLLPSFVVDPAGGVAEVRGTAEVIDQMAELDPRIRTAASAPGFAATLEASISTKYWDVWAGGWADWGSFEEADEEGFYEDQDDTDVDFTMHSVGTSGSGRAVLRRVEVVGGAELLELLVGTLTGFGTDVPQEEIERRLAGFEGERRTTMEVVTDPATLRPDSSHLRIALDATMDGERQQQVEERTTRFDWPASTCA